MDIVESVNTYLEVNRSHGHTSSKEKKFYISDMGKCHRVRWLKRKGIQAEFAPYVIWMFQIGDLYHDFVYKVLEGNGSLLSSEDYVSTDHFVGRYDGIVKSEKDKSVLDIKSISGYKLAKIMKGEDDENNVAQVLTYQMLLMEQGMKDLSKSILFYLNKEPGDRYPNTFFAKQYRLTSWREKKLQDEMDILINYWVEKKIPPCTCPGWMKPYNAYLPFCSMSQKDINKYLSTLKKGIRVVTTNKKIYFIDKKDKKKEAKIK